VTPRSSGEDAARPPASVAARLRRLLAILAWLAPRGEVAVDEVAQRFGLDPDALVAELELASCCGVPPYSPDQLMEILIDDETVTVSMGTALAQPRRLTSREGFALAAAARALLAVPGSDDDGALSRALAKLETALGPASVEIALDLPDALPLLRSAVEDGGRVAVTYYTGSADRLTERTIRPRRLFTADGRWYVDAFCELVGDNRRFRVDRIVEAAPAPADGGRTPVPEGEAGALPEGWQTSPAYLPWPDSRRVVVSVPADRAWLLEAVPGAEPRSARGGRVRVELDVSGEAWLERLLLRLGPEARIEVDEGRGGRAADPAAAAASRILARYR
jgi:proteasome accessory factor C